MNGSEVFNYTSVSTEIVKGAREELARLGYQLVHIAKKSDHPEDNYLYVVVARKKSGSKAYALWTLNSSRFSLNNGHYELSYPKVMAVYAGALYSAFQQ